MNTIKTLLNLILFLPVFAFSQKKENFEQVDSLAMSVKYKNHLSALVEELTKPYSEDQLKARAIFRWITEKIRYDYQHYNKYYYKGKEPKTYTCKDNENCEAKRIVWETKYINKVLRRKKAVCQGYSMLFKKMCDIAGLKSEIVTGYVRTEYSQVGTPGTLNHAWNVVWIDSAYYLLDPTWAAGGCPKNEDGKLWRFQKHYYDYYWLTPPPEFAKNHYPEDNRWVLVPGYSKEKFCNNPYYAGRDIDNIKLITPASGIINVKAGDTIRFKLEYARDFQDLQINSNVFHNPDIWVWKDPSKRRKGMREDTIALKKQQYVKYNRTGNLYEFEYVVSNPSVYYLEILFDRLKVLRFKVNTKRG